MRRVLIIGTLLLAGCGEAERVAGPQSVAPKFNAPGKGELPLGEPAAPRDRVSAGATGVMGLDGRVGVRPERLAIAEDAELERIRWTSDAEGEGRLALLECDPDCASGRTRIVRATVRLSDPVDCPEGRFYDRATVTVAGADPMSFIQAPC